MEMALLVLLITVIVLQLVSMFRRSHDDTEKLIKNSEDRVVGGISNLNSNINAQFTEMIRRDAEGQRESDRNTSSNIERMRESLEGRMDGFKGNVNETLDNINNRLIETIRANSEAQRSIGEKLEISLANIHSLTERKLSDIQKDVNEKLDTSLNKRLDDSFEKVTTQLGLLYKSIGELGEMSNGISNLNKTLSNVKTRGTWGEIQLGSILEETMTQSQYEKNVKLRDCSDDMVEYAIRIPARDENEKMIYLPLDSKFPLDIYGNLVDAADSGDKEAIDRYVKELENRIKSEAKSIRDKYINPPKTTDFAIMFLPTESMYAEVLRINGLAEFCQNKYRVIISGPSTITALLNSLRVGFANVALNKKTAEVRKILEAVKTQYGVLDELIDKTKKKLDDAVSSTDNLKKRTEIIRKRMSKVGEIELGEADSILGIEENTVTDSDVD